MSVVKLEKDNTHNMIHISEAITALNNAVLEMQSSDSLQEIIEIKKRLESIRDQSNNPIPYTVIVEALNIRLKPTIKSQIANQVKYGKTLDIDSSVQPVRADGWVWRQLTNGYWVAEFNTSTHQRLLTRGKIELMKRNEDAIDTQPIKITANGRVRVNGRAFTLDGRPFRFIGVNLRELAFYGSHVLPHTRELNVDQQLQNAKSMGATVVRLIASHRQFDTDSCINLLRKSLDRIHNHGMLGIVAFTDALGVSGYIINKNDNYHSQIMGHVGKSVFFVDEGYRNLYLPFVERVVSELKYHPAIFAWELGNEFAIHPQPATQEDTNAFLKFADRVSSSIRRSDRQHLITTGLVNSNHFASNGNQSDAARTLYSLPHIDFATVHFYQGDNVEINASNREYEYVNKMNIPLVVEEFGTTAGHLNRNQYLSQTLNDWMLHKRVSGFMQWGFSATGSDIGVGDNRHGMDNYSPANAALYYEAFNIYRDVANKIK